MTKRARTPKQHSLFESCTIETSAKSSLQKEWRKLKRTTHGGANTRGRRKEYRPLSAKKWTHLILKSDKAKGAYNLLTPRNQIFIADLLKRKAKQFGIVIQCEANVGNHLHLKLRFKTRDGFQNFLRAITTQIARFVTGARRGKPFGRFWEGLAYTRVVKTAKEELQLRGYIQANQIEAASSKTSRTKWLGQFNSWVQSLGSS